MAFLVTTSTAMPAAALPSTHLLIGTCVEADSIQGAANLTVFFLPDSTMTTTDSEGDFILDWSGRAGFLQIERPDRDACRRIAVSAAQTDDNLDLGRIRAPRGIASRFASLDRGSTPPDTVRAPDHEGPSIRYWFLLHATFDLWGRPLDVVRQSGDPDTPDALITSSRTWARTAAWQFRREARCEDPAFEATIPLAYQWNSTVKAWIRDPDNRPK